MGKMGRGPLKEREGSRQKEGKKKVILLSRKKNSMKEGGERSQGEEQRDIGEGREVGKYARKKRKKNWSTFCMLQVLLQLSWGAAVQETRKNRRGHKNPHIVLTPRKERVGEGLGAKKNENFPGQLLKKAALLVFTGSNQERCTTRTSEKGKLPNPLKGIHNWESPAGIIGFEGEEIRLRGTKERKEKTLTSPKGKIPHF